jgi:hypothetical protein
VAVKKNTYYAYYPDRTIIVEAYTVRGAENQAFLFTGVWPNGVMREFADKKDAR